MSLKENSIVDSFVATPHILFAKTRMVPLGVAGPTRDSRWSRAEPHLGLQMIDAARLNRYRAEHLPQHWTRAYSTYSIFSTIYHTYERVTSGG